MPKSIILQALNFSTMSHRHIEIVEAHRKTFSWIFHPSQACGGDEASRYRPWSDFTEWLREKSGIYWINGKAGSGKSTLMRYISDHENTQECLKYWSSSADLLVSSFYFWNSGTPLQRSSIGLLRSLLYDILTRRPELIREFFASEWSSIYDWTREGAREEIDFSRSFRRLEKAFIHLSQLALKDIMICLFVDGLDEYDGDPETLIEIFLRISGSPHLKVCVSSRQWLIFEEAFEKYPGLRLQDLTRNDIRCYVIDTLLRNRRMERLQQSNPVDADLLATNIANMANGIFLWVYIVTKSLLDGLRNQDSISDLQRRLDVLPSDLDALYNHMMNHINQLYIKQASRIFQIFVAYADAGHRPTVLELELAVTADYSAAMAPPSEMTQFEIDERSGRMIAHIKSRCEGLLEIHDIQDRHWESVAEEEIRLSYHSDDSTKDLENPCNKDESELERRLKINLKVCYLHRTVKDFLKTEAVRSRLERYTSVDKTFDPNMLILMSYVLNLKRSLRTLNFSFGRYEYRRIRTTTADVMAIAQRIDGENEQYADVLLEYFRQTCHWWMNPSGVLAVSAPKFVDWLAEFLSFATWLGLWKYIEKYLRSRGSSSFLPDSTCLLPYALGVSQPQSFTSGKYLRQPKMIKVLLQYGADPKGLPDGHESTAQLLGSDHNSNNEASL
jgi:hypothetical protein